MNPWDNDPVDQPLKVEINGTAADVPPEPWNADPIDEQPDVRAGTVPAVDVDPEKAARARALAQATGIPASILEEDPAPAERRLKLERLDAAAAADPAVASVLSDPETAKLAHDDVENLSLIGETVRSFGRFFGAIGAAIPQVNAGLWGVVRAGADIVGLDAAAAYAAERQGEQRGFVQDLRPQTGNWVLDAAYSGVTSAAQSALMAPAGAAGLLTGFGLTTGGDAYGQARDAGKGVGESLAFGASQGVIEAGTEMLPAGAFLRMMKGETGGAVLKTIKEFAAKEAIGEQVATALQDLNEWAVLHPERPFSEYLAERPGAAAETLISTIVSVGASTTAAQALQAYGERAQRGVEAAKQAEQLLKASAASQLRARDPEAFRRFLTEASTDENGDESTFFIDGRAFAQAIGSTGVSFEEFRARAPELAQQMIDAVQTGGDIEIPVADFATAFAGTQEGATLLQHVRTSPDAASAAEAAVFAQTQPEVLQQEIERATAEAVGEEVGQRSETTVRDRILQQLQSTGRYNDEVAGINAQVAASMFTALGAKMGRTAEQVMADFPLRIVGENPAAPGEVLQATDDPQFRAWFGDSKVVDESGAPLVVYHGTNAEFNAFDPNMVGRNFRQSSGGFFFISSRDSAEFYAEDAADAADAGEPRVVEAYLSVKNPLVVTTDLMPETFYDDNAASLLERADEGGHDGIIVRGFEWDGEGGSEGTPRDVYVVFSPTQIKSVFNRGTWDANDPNILNQRAPSSRFEVRREKSTGRYVGAPDWVGSSPQKLAALRKNLKKLAEEGRAGQFWYEDSARAVMDLVGGDPVEAEKFIALLAIYSQGTEVSANVTFALTAYYQWKAGLPINTGRFPSSQSAKAEAVLRRNEGWGGIKTNNFYNDLMEEIDPSKMDESHATMDMWMAIAFDYGANVLDQGPKYGFAKAIIQSLADEMGVRPHQVQAMIWTAIKYRVESTEAKRREIERKRGIQVQAEDGSWVVPKEKEYDHFRLAFKLAMQAPLDQAGMNASKFDFGDALRDRMVMISWEAAPSTSPGRSLPGIHTAPLEQQFEYLSAVRRATSDEKGRDLIADLAGLPQGSTVEGFGAWQAMVRAGAQTMLAVPSEGAGKTRTVRPVAKELLDLYSAIRGYVLEQDAVVYHTPVWDDAKIRHNGVHLSTARPLHAEEVRMLYSALHEKFGTWELAPGWRPDGARVLNFVEGLDNKDFQKGLAEVVAALPEDFGGGDVSAETFRSDGDYIGNDWQENPNGEAYLARIEARQPDILGRVADLRAAVEAVNAQFAARYGWDRAEPEGERGDERAGDGRAVPSAAAVGASPLAGIHFSHAARTVLDGRYYGTGLRGEEAKRVFASDDRRLHERVYTYINWGKGVTPEAGLGPVAHEVMLPTLYDPSEDPLGLWNANDLNGSEAAILDAGYHGYFIRQFGLDHGAAVVIGSASRGLQAKVIDAPPTVAPATGRRPFAGKYRTQLTSKEMDALDPHMDEVRAAAPSASLSFGTFMAEEGEAQAAREVAAKYGVALPEQSLAQSPISFFGLGGIENNASGESAASLEAQGRVESERRQGRTRVVVDKTGNVRPLIGVDAVDQRAYPGQVILQRGVGRDEWTVLDSGEGVTEGDRARAISRAQASLAQRREQNRGTFKPSTLTISLLEKADLSTFLHELGHFGLEMMVEIAAQPGAPQSVIDDVRIILDWLGVKDIQSWRAMTLDEQRPYHEQFAEGFETYLFEGKSPSAELNSAFARIAAWMLNVYKSLTSMRVKLTPEVRGVFDRMLATNDQIAEQARLRNMAPLFSDPSQAGMSAKDWAAYQEVGAQAARDAVADLRTRTLRDMRWMANAKGRALKKLQDSAKEIRRGVRAEVEEQVDAQPVYAAMAFIERGTMADRDLSNAQRKALDTLAGGKTKLSLPALKALYGEGPAAPWRYIKQTLVAAEDGADPDAVAAAFGFDSGDALVRAILSAEPRQQLVEALTDKRMLEEHADLSDPVQIELAAGEAIHNEARIRFVATEMKALQEGMSAREQVGETKVRKGKNAGQTRALTVDGLVRAATQYAEQIVGRTVVRRLSPTKHARAAANEAKAAAEAMKTGDLQTALAHKRNQLLHERTSKAMSEAITTFEKNLGYLRKFRRSNRARGAIDADYVEQIENLLNAIDTRNQTNKRLESINSLKKWIAEQEAEGLPVALDEELIESLQITNVRDLTVDQLQALVDQVKSIEHLGKLKKKLLTARDKREFDAIADELAATIREHGGKPREVPFAPGAHEHRFKRLWEGFFAEHRKLASLARQMDGVVDDGPMWRALIRGMNDAGNRETSLIAQSTKALADIFRPITKMKGGLTGNKLLIPALGQSLSRGERMAVLLNWGNEHGRQRVLNTVPLAAVEQIMATMSREEALAIQAVWDHINEYWPDIAAKEKRVTGTAPEKVDALPFTMVLADGTSIEMRGGYYPLVYESEMSDVAAAHEQAQVAKDMQAGAYTRATTRRGHTKKRAEKVGEPLRFTLDVIDRHVSQVVHDLAWHEWLIDAGRLLRDKRISSAIRDHYGPATLKVMKDTLSDIATGDLQRMSRVEALAAGIRARTSAAVMGWSLTTALLQPFGIAQSIPRVGAVWIARGMRHWAGDALRLENSARLIREKSAMMRHRSTTFNRDIREVTARIHQGKGPIAEAFDASLFIAMQKLQLIADIPTWWGAYEKALAEVDDEGRAVALADQAVLDAQGGGQVKDLAGVQRGNELKRALSMFYSYFSATWNMASESTARTNFRKPAQVAGWLADMVVLSVVPELAQQVVFSLLRGGGGDDDKDWEERMLDLFKQLGAFWMNTLIGVREFSGMVQGFDYNGPAAARAIVEAGNVGKAAGKALDPDEDLDDNDYRRVLKSVLTILGWPAAQVDRSWRGWKAWQEGEAGPGAVLLGPPPKD